MTLASIVLAVGARLLSTLRPDSLRQGICFYLQNLLAYILDSEYWLLEALAFNGVTTAPTSPWKRNIERCMRGSASIINR
ncbi:uncharacterized protein BDV17DRAFT_117411 [Aspergillus undulatus]|uniref:uncharacterized protein n=1 Tax=Aspergillus undulatus TaxID=1810928 RepID=UPI003CCD6D62